MQSANRGSFISSFQIIYPDAFCFFSCLIVLARAASTVLNTSSERGLGSGRALDLGSIPINTKIHTHKHTRIHKRKKGGRKRGRE
jgi:hypothetical protein